MIWSFQSDDRPINGWQDSEISSFLAVAAIADAHRGRIRVSVEWCTLTKFIYALEQTDDCHEH